MPRGILHLNLQTSTLPALRSFYSQTLQLSLSLDSPHQLSIRAGSTNLTFTSATDNPFYHFAFNIPENKLSSARHWLTSRGVELLKNPDDRDEHHFASWNAHAIYFFDPAGNIVEFIARHGLKNSTEGDFSPADILYASEIGVVVDDVKAAAAAIQAQLGLTPFANPPFDTFAALGDDHRLLIMVRRGRAWNIGGPRPASIFPTTAVLAGPYSASLKLFDLPHHVSLTAT